MENDFPVISLEEPLLPEIVANHLIEYIQQNHLKANDRLPNELDLARSFGVSRGTVRSAIALLKSRNIVVRKRGSGTYIAENTGQIDDPFGLSFAQDKRETVQRLTETRGVLEPGITALAAERASEEDISEMIRLAELGPRAAAHKKKNTCERWIAPLSHVFFFKCRRCGRPLTD